MAYGVYDEILQSAENYAYNALRGPVSDQVRSGNFYVAAGLARAAMLVAQPYDREATSAAGLLFRDYIKRAREIAGLAEEG